MDTINYDLKLAFDTLTAKASAYTTKYNYYEGKHPLVYSSARLREVFRGLDANFVENWCSVVVNVPWNRLTIKQLEVTDDDEATAALQALWSRLHLGLDADDIHRAALITGEAFEVVWEALDNPEQATSYFNDPRTCHVFTMPEDPRTPRMACKWWQEGKRYRINLYYADRIEKYVTHEMNSAPTSAQAFQPMWETEPDVNPYEQIPVFRWSTGTASVLDNAIPPQAAINKLLADEMVAAEFGAFKQRYIISNADTSELKNAPNEIWDVPAGDGAGQHTSVGQFDATNLSNYEVAIERRISALSSLTGIPQHFFQKSGGNAPSGEALNTMEAPLIKQIRRMIERFKVTWQQYAAFLLRIEGYDVKPSAIVVTYEAPETVQPRTQAEIRQINVNSGMPLRTALREDGWDEQRIQQMEEDRREENAELLASTSNLGGELLRNFESGSFGGV